MERNLSLNSDSYFKAILLENYLELSVSHRLLDQMGLLSFLQQLIDIDGKVEKEAEIESFVRGRYIASGHSEAFIEKLLLLESKLMQLGSGSCTPETKPKYKNWMLSRLFKLWSPLHFQLSDCSLIYKSYHGELEYWYSQKTGETLRSQSGCWMIKRNLEQIKVTPISNLQFQLVKRIQRGWSYSKLCKHYTNEQIEQNLLPAVCGGILVLK
ncbi:MAG: hypothetical protein OQJ89_06005 [Kangiellaceae bacterium]|nr:hypothetical protein [Kangiellaceae bacterium]MCW8998139.1 hypothetical protein [Kangiellaceae bacterium]MCW9016495.1 hypothetical protein [Kangiellaceae bacterium]